VRILDRFRLAEDTSTRGADLIGELGTHLEEVAGTVAFLVSVVVELRQEVAELKGGRR
jgi:hypothetical protein